MENKKKMHKDLEDLLEKTNAQELLVKNKELEPDSFFKKQRKKRVHKTLVEEEKLIKNNKLERKINKKHKTVIPSEDENLKALQSRRFQTINQINNGKSTSALQMHLVQSESLKIAQEKIRDLEEEILSLREKNESLISAGEVLKENNETIKVKLEDLKANLSDEKQSFKDEKEVLLSVVEEAREQITKLRNKNQELEKRLSSSFHGIRQRENSLEGRIEILKMENSALQKEKDKKLLDLKKEIFKLKNNLENSHKRNHQLTILNNKLKEGSRRVVSALRATIYSLEAVKLNEETGVSENEEEKKAS